MNRWAPRVTVAAVVERGGEFLLVEEWVDGSLVLNQPAGHLEPGESLTEAAVREAREETGWNIRLQGLLGIYRYVPPGGDTTFLRFAFCASALSHDPEQPLDEGIRRTIWMTPEQIRAAAGRLRSPLVLRAVEHYRHRRPMPLDVLDDVGSHA